MRPLHLVIPFAIALGASAAPMPASAQIALDVTVTEPPPELPVYDQPPLPGPGYIFTPGFWAYGDDGYYWVPGTWVEPPEPGLLWTPGYWGWNGGRYIFNSGYWGPEVGFYGGINYGFGYGGFGYEGGYWRGGQLFYNSRVNNFGGVHVTNVYVRNVTNVTVNRVSFNGGRGGIDRRPLPAELAAARGPHVPATSVQVQHIQVARQNPGLRAAVNHGRPPILATPRPAGVDRGTGAAMHGAPGPHPVTPGQGVGHSHAGGQMGLQGGAASPHPVSHGMAPRPHYGNAPGGAMLAPAAQPHHMQPGAPRPMSESRPMPMNAQRPMPMGAPRPMPMGAPRPMQAAPRPMGMAPQPGGMGGPRPGGAMSAPHPAAPAPRPAGGGHEPKPQH